MYQKQAAKKELVKNESTKSLWISDWGQKVLPMLYRESMVQYFGKAGKASPAALVTQRMAKAIYALKLFLFQKQFGLSKSVIKKLERFVKFVVLVYVQEWILASFAEEAAVFDLRYKYDVNTCAGCYTICRVSHNFYNIEFDSFIVR